MKARIVIALSSLLLGLAGLGCAADVGDESEGEDAEQTEEGLAFNCVGRCVDEYRACVAATGQYTQCAAEREACKQECYANTCEPGDPGCCQGQPTCW